ncbi:hypothetical protein D3C81_1176630 [compost metagenome]
MAAEAVGQQAGLGRAVGARQVDHREQAHPTHAQRIGRLEQAVADVVEQGDEAAHQQERFEKQPGQAAVGQVQAQAAGQVGEAQRRRAKVPRVRQQAPEQQGGEQRQSAEGGHRHLPGEEVDQHAADQSAAHAAEGVAGDVQAHGQPQVLGMDFLAEIGHRHRHQAAERQADQRAHQQQGVPVGHQRAEQGAQRGGAQGRDHHRLAADGVRQRAGEQQADGQGHGRHRQHQAALRRAEGKGDGQYR